MRTNHFNGLTEAEAERLAILIEECGEVTQSACKILRHGFESNNKGKIAETNREGLQRELGDLLHALDRLADSGDIDARTVYARAKSKPESILPYLHHQAPRTELDRLRDQEERLENGFGHGAFLDGQTQAALSEVRAKIKQLTGAGVVK